MRTKLYKIIVLILISSLLNKFTVSCKEKNKELKMIRGKQIEISADLESDSIILNDIQPYHDELESKITEVLCYNPRNLSREEAALESSLGNFYADVCLKSADSIFQQKTGKHIDFALFNYGGIRTAIPKGSVTVEQIFKLMPFENKLVVAQLSGSKVVELFDYLAMREQAHPLAGLHLELKDKEFSKIEIQGKIFDPNKNYWVLTHDYLQHGGDNMSFFTEPLELFISGYKVRDALIDNLRKVDTLHCSLDNRFSQIN
jgi:5'-nucleotidase